MRNIGNINIKNDGKTKKMLAMFRGYRPKIRRSASDNTKYFLPEVTQDALIKQNVVLDPATGKCRTTTEGEAFENDSIIFSGRPGTSTTHASACFSYMLFSKQAKVAAAAHVFSSHLHDPEFHLDTILYALANLKKMSPRTPISAHICGGFAVFENETIRRSMMFKNNEILRGVVFEMLNWGVVIRSVNIGDDYLYQKLRIPGWEYSIKRLPPEKQILRL